MEVEGQDVREEPLEERDGLPKLLSRNGSIDASIVRVTRSDGPPFSFGLLRAILFPQQFAMAQLGRELRGFCARLGEIPRRWYASDGGWRLN
jgi:hypothetical protein